MSYRISKSSDLTTILETAAVIDTAFARVAELSKSPENFGVVFVAWVPENDGQDKRVRVFASAGRSRWAKPCSVKVTYYGSHYGCHTCGGLGLVEDCPS